MKKVIIFLFLMIFTLSASAAFSTTSDKKVKTDNPALPVKTENKLSEEEMSRLSKRVEEIRDMDKTNMTVKEKRAVKKELKEIKSDIRNSGGVVYIGTGTLILIIILVILLV